jgi:hypothetical protein
MRLRVDSNKYQAGLHFRWDKGRTLYEVSGSQAGGMPGSGSPELEILVDGKRQDFEGNRSSLRHTFFQGPIVIVPFLPVITSFFRPCPSTRWSSHHEMRFSPRDIGLNRVKPVLISSRKSIFDLYPS